MVKSRQLILKNVVATGEVPSASGKVRRIHLSLKSNPLNIVWVNEGAVVVHTTSIRLAVHMIIVSHRQLVILGVIK